MSKLLTVFGATGAQGGSVVGQVLSNPELSKVYRIRGITRDISKPTSVGLKDRGVEVVAADLNDHSSLKKAVTDSDVVFALTNFWDPSTLSGEKEMVQGKALADACVAANVPLIIWSNTPSIKKDSNGELPHASHTDSKAEVAEYIRGLDIKSVFWEPMMFMQNFQTFFRPQPTEDGGYAINNIWNPDSLIPIIDITVETGKYIEAVLLHPDKYNQKTILGIGGFYTPNELVETMSQVTGNRVKYVQVPDEIWKSFLPQGAQDELLDNMIYFRELFRYKPDIREQWNGSLKLTGVEPTTWKEFLQRESPWF